MSVLEVPLSEAVIKRYQADPAVRELKDPRHPLRLRYHAGRAAASWHLVLYRGGKAQWTKLGNWPALSVKACLAQLSELIARHSAGERGGLDQWERVGDLLRWYRERALSDRSLSRHRKSTIKWALDRHLLPLLGGETITELDHSLLDNEFIWPLQARYQLSTVRQLFALLKVAFRRAVKLRKLAGDPLAGLVFGDFISADIKPRASRLQLGHLPDLLATIAAQPTSAAMLLWLLLAHGWRRGETRQLSWDWVDLDNDRLTIPGEVTKSGEPLTVPLTQAARDRLTAYRYWQRHRGYRGPCLFPSSSQRGPVSDATVGNWVAAASGGRWSAHDLRKLARTCWADQGTDYLVAERLLNHALARLDQAYIHTTVELQKRRALEAWHLTLQQTETKTTPRRPATSGPGEPAPHLAAPATDEFYHRGITR
jgi:integrase